MSNLTLSKKFYYDWNSFELFNIKLNELNLNYEFSCYYKISRVKHLKLIKFILKTRLNYFNFNFKTLTFQVPLYLNNLKLSLFKRTKIKSGISFNIGVTYTNTNNCVQHFSLSLLAASLKRKISIANSQPTPKQVEKWLTPIASLHYKQYVIGSRIFLIFPCENFGW